ncbi:MAG: hypothetical protein QW680_09365 [Pyrobaculum sp.]
MTFCSVIEEIRKYVNEIVDVVSQCHGRNMPLSHFEEIRRRVAQIIAMTSSEDCFNIHIEAKYINSLLVMIIQLAEIRGASVCDDNLLISVYRLNNIVNRVYSSSVEESHRCIRRDIKYDVAEARVSRVFIEGFKWVGVGSLIIGRCDPKGGTSSQEISWLCIKNEQKDVLFNFKDFECRWGCAYGDPVGCCHREHLKVDVREHHVVIKKLGEFPVYCCVRGGKLEEIYEVTLRPGESIKISVAGLKYRERSTGVVPCLNILVE